MSKTPLSIIFITVYLLVNNLSMVLITAELVIVFLSLFMLSELLEHYANATLTVVHWSLQNRKCVEVTAAAQV